MPRNTLQHLSTVAGDSAPNPRASEAIVERALPADVQRLLAERRRLEAQMGSLVGQSSPAPTKTDLRFPVTPLAERRRLDAAWAERRDRAEPKQNPGGEALLSRELPVLGAPPPRSGQRGIFEPPTRSGLRQYQGFSAGAFERDRDREAGEQRPAIDARALEEFRSYPRLSTPELREFGRSLRSPTDRPLRSVDDRMRQADRRLDIWNGGSGDLNRLRTLAVERLQARRREQRSDGRRDAQRLSRPRRGERDETVARRDRRRGF